jgi:peroxiredoxin
MRCSGDSVPLVTFRLRRDGAWQEQTSAALFQGRRVVLFAVPAAFSTTCSARHLAGYVALSKNIRAMGIDEIFCLAVNDAFVMNAWARDQGIAGEVTLLPDGNADFTREMGMLVDQAPLGVGWRSRRYSMVVQDGVIESLFAEERLAGADRLEVSDAITLLDHLDARTRCAAE